MLGLLAFLGVRSATKQAGQPGTGLVVVVALLAAHVIYPVILWVTIPLFLAVVGYCLYVSRPGS